MAPEKNVERSNWHDERLDLRLGGEFPRVLSWQSYSLSGRITPIM
ncbi:MAG: hypothetical protein QOI88_2608 [Gammaproteobacteria bacterium]|jgi:hypothetical protein|nr:hypothetical protein [Gammaproteobacteria bacterium]